VRKKDIKEVDDAIKELENELGQKIDRDMSRELHDEIQRVFGKGGNPSYQEILDLGRALWKK
jgi:hypothetical protein